MRFRFGWSLIFGSLIFLAALRLAAEEKPSIQVPRVDHAPRLEDLERQLTVLEEKLFAVLMAATPDEDLVNVRAEADRDIAPYRRNMTVAQVEQLHRQYVHKRLLEQCGVPRLSLFYMH